MPIRPATPDDTDALRRIYGQYLDTPITFECVLPDSAAFRARIEGILAGYPYLVYEEAGAIRGYAYAHAFHERSAYQWGAELSVYLDRDWTSLGVGRQLYTALMELLRLQGIRTVYGCVTVPNEKSEGLHAALGFARVATFHAAGFKAGAWHDVAWFEKAIAPYDADPFPIRPFPAVEAADIAAVLERFA